ncbi:MAG: PP2C family protein-serine/threonine phosphatase [Acidobacteria bacterium]|nr:PP2C family protein-serine/threonine phosphatase [Acidobacteriota bacterium]
MDSRGFEGRLDASRLESLLESAKLLSSSLELDDQLRHLMRTVMGRLLVTRAVIALRAAEGGAMRVAIVRGLPGLKAGAAFAVDDAAAMGLPYSRWIGDQAEPLGLVAIGEPARGGLDEGEQSFLDALLSLASASIANARAHDGVVRANRTLDTKIQELRALLDMVRGLAGTIDPEGVASLLMLTLSGRWAVRKHALHTWKPGQEPITRVKGVTGEQLSQMAAALGESDAPVETGEWVVFPIRSGESTTGLVALGPRPGDAGYSPADLDFGMGMVGQASVALDNAWHFRDTLYRQQLEKELALAAAIQQDLFPKSMPALAGTDIAARNRQAKQVGGDYYDVLPVGEESAEGAHLLCVADISGKGISASLLMANIQATLRALLSAHPALAELSGRTNDLLYASTPGNKYATAIFVRYEGATGRCEYVNGGHCDGILLRASGEVEMLTTTGLPVGLFPKREFEVKEFAMGEGDTLMLYSDGVTDACTADEREFGVERAVEVLRRNAGLPAAAIQDAVFQAIDEFVEGAAQFDDITVMVVKRQA